MVRSCWMPTDSGPSAGRCCTLSPSSPRLVWLHIKIRHHIGEKLPGTSLGFFSGGNNCGIQNIFCPCGESNAYSTPCSIFIVLTKLPHTQLHYFTDPWHQIPRPRNPQLVRVLRNPLKLRIWGLVLHWGRWNFRVWNHFSEFAEVYLLNYSSFNNAARNLRRTVSNCRILGEFWIGNNMAGNFLVVLWWIILAFVSWE